LLSFRVKALHFLPEILSTATEGRRLDLNPKKEHPLGLFVFQVM